MDIVCINVILTAFSMFKIIEKILKCNQIFSIQQFENALSKGIFDIKSTLQIKLMH